MSATNSANIRRASPTDAPAINHVIERVWDQRSKSDEHLAAVIEEPDHRTFVAELDGDVCGFVDGFVTLTAEGKRRWEVDLLAVDPDFQRRGLAAALVEANVNASHEFAVEEWRSLIHIDNLASQRTFQRCGFTLVPEVYSLFVANGSTSQQTLPIPNAYFIPVTTFTYTGLWIEGQQSPEALIYARAIAHRMKFDTSGALIPDTSPLSALMTESDTHGYGLIGQYQFYRR